MKTSSDEVTLNEDDYIGIDTSNIIPRTRRRAAVAAMALPMHDDLPADKEDDDDSDSDNSQSSDEAEF